MPKVSSKTNIIKLVIGIILLIGVMKLILNFYNEYSNFELFYGKKLTLGLATRLMYNSRTFLNPIILILSLLGFFIHRPIGWILTNNIFTYVLAFMYLISFPTDNLGWYYYFIGFIPIGLITLMNQKSIIELYKINKSNLLTLNLLSMVIGLVFAFLFGYFILNSGENYLDVIYNK